MVMRLVTPFTGTVRRDKRFLPQKFSAKKELGLYQSAFGFQEHRMLCSYQGHRSKNVILVSSMHNEAALDPSNEKQKPEVVLFYNETKGGVDSMDKMALSYTTKRSTKRWPLVLFCNLLDLSTIAARVVYQEKHPNEKLCQKIARGDFIREVAKSLMRDQIIRRSETLVRASHPLKKLFEKTLESLGINVRTPQAGPSLPIVGSRKRGRCGKCPWKKDRKGVSMCHKCNMFLCKEHSIIVGAMPA